jgi:phospholipid/cholesterol/gamma-HCH transport system substrate-binding protein
MEESGYRFGVGVLVLASAIIGVLLVAFFGTVPSLLVDRYRVSFNFDRAPKVVVDTPVRKNGVQIGRVSAISLLPGNEGVNLTMELNKKYEISKREVPKISVGSFITGDAVIEFVKPSDLSLSRFDGSISGVKDGVIDSAESTESNQIMSDGYFSRGGEVAPDPLEFIGTLEKNFVPLLSSVERAMNRFDTIGASVQTIVGEGSVPIKDLVSSTKNTLDNINQTVGTINRVATQVERSDLPGAIANGLELLPDLFKEAQATLGQTQRTLKGFEKFSESLEGLGSEFEGIGESIRKAVDNANIAIENIAEITEPISQNSDRLVTNVVQTLADIDILAKDLKRFTSMLNNSNGSISKLINEDQLYISLLSTIKSIEASSGNVQVLTQKLQPIIADARVFTDKVARDPGQLGVRGVLSNRPQGIGLK